MELWIRSQDKEKLVRVDNIEVQHHYSYKDTQEKYLLSNGSFEWRNVQKIDKYIKSVIFGNDEIKLGEYSTKERALEVLDEIQDNILHEVHRHYSGEILISNIDGIYVYEMPKE